METPLQETSPTKSSLPSANHDRAEENMASCREAVNQKEEVDPDAELDRIYPPAHGYHRLFHAVYVNREGESVGPDYHRLHPDDYPPLEMRAPTPEELRLYPPDSSIPEPGTNPK